MRIKVKTLTGRNMKVDTERLDAILQHKVEKNIFYLLRTGQYEYRQLTSTEAELAVIWMQRHRKEPGEVTTTEVEKAIEGAKEIEEARWKRGEKKDKLVILNKEGEEDVHRRDDGDGEGEDGDREEAVRQGQDG